MLAARGCGKKPKGSARKAASPLDYPVHLLYSFGRLIAGFGKEMGRNSGLQTGSPTRDSVLFCRYGCFQSPSRGLFTVRTMSKKDLDLRPSKPRSSSVRIGSGLAAAVFAVTSSLAAIGSHPFSQHQLHSGDIIANRLVAISGGEPEAAGPSALTGNAHSSHHEGSEQCTCVGACQGGGSASLAPESSTAGLGPVDPASIRGARALAVLRARVPYLLPFPNARPSARLTPARLG